MKVSLFTNGICFLLGEFHRSNMRLPQTRAYLQSKKSNANQPRLTKKRYSLDGQRFVSFLHSVGVGKCDPRRSLLVLVAQLLVSYG